MSFSDSANRPQAIDYTPEIQEALAALAAVQPREGLEQRILSRLASAPELSWYQRWIAVPVGHHRWALAAASVAIVAGGVSLTTFRPHPAAITTPVAVHLPRPAQQPAAAAAGIAVSEHPLEPNKTKTRHRGVHRSFRAMHDRVPLPRGTVAPIRPQPVPLNQ
jgi:hypothetical protein